MYINRRYERNQVPYIHGIYQEIDSTPAKVQLSLCPIIEHSLLYRDRVDEWQTDAQEVLKRDSERDLPWPGSL